MSGSWRRTCLRASAKLCVKAFEALHSADGLRFETRSEIPLARGLGSSAAAIVAGLVAADHMFELGLEREQLYARAVELEGHPDNVGAALYGGLVLCPPLDGGQMPAPVRLDPPEGVEGVVVILDINFIRAPSAIDGVLLYRYRSSYLYVEMISTIREVANNSGRIVDHLQVSLPRPRTYEMLSGDTFGTLRDRIWRHIRKSA